ncbi:MAG: hypothetical protein ACK4IX_01365 [Candidatus Sericytochromatia bacterium]|jgi:hypothetical protein
MGNLLTYKKTFEWEDTKIDRGESISKLNGAIIKSKEYDVLYKTIDFNSISLTWGDFMEFIFNYGYDEAIREQTFPWMSQLQHTTLVYILSSFKNTTEIVENDLNSLKAQNSEENYGYIGFSDPLLTDDYVYCESTLFSFHAKYVSSFDRKKRLADGNYFMTFYTPELKKDLNQINQKINQGKYNALFKRLDKPSKDPNGNILHGEKIQMHFNDEDKCALNIDGIWKHKHFILPDDVCEKLIEWGFILPENRN